jgi:type I restriction enzyme R subunit
MNIEWNFFDRNADSLVTKRNMPHLDMPGHLTFVTFRLADSMPRDVVEKWHDEIEVWLKEHDLGGRTVEEVLNADKIDDSLKNELRKFKNRKWHGHLDDCFGDCILRKPQPRKLVKESLLHFDGKRYDLERFVLMPNHVHLLIQMRQGFLLRKQLTETMRYTGRQVNALLKQEGDFWQSEPFDHVVRSDVQFEYLQRYIAENPAKAGLSEGEYTLWIRPK